MANKSKSLLKNLYTKMPMHQVDKLNNSELARLQSLVDSDINLARSWAKDPNNISGGVFTDQPTLYDCMEQLCFISTKWMIAQGKIEGEKFDAAIEVIELVQASRGFIEADQPDRAANTAANAAATFYTFGLEKHAESLRKEAEELEIEVNNFRNIKRKANDNSKDTRAKKAKKRYEIIEKMISEILEKNPHADRRSMTSIVIDRLKQNSEIKNLKIAIGRDVVKPNVDRILNKLNQD